jgi:NO-binding membrane sensor protein with MHYT domain
MLRPKLKHGIFYKICTAIILAIAVCCMHFCGKSCTFTTGLC